MTDKNNNLSLARYGVDEQGEIVEYSEGTYIEVDDLRKVVCYILNSHSPLKNLSDFFSEMET